MSARSNSRREAELSTEDKRLLCWAIVLGVAALALFALLAYLGFPLVPMLARTCLAPML